MKKIAVIDIETTDLKPHNGLIVEIGIVELNLKTGDIKVILDTHVKELGFGIKHRDSWIFENSEMLFEDVEGAPPLNSLKYRIQEILNQYRITAFNKSFDLGFLKSRGFKVHEELPCIMLTATDIIKIEREWGYKWPSAQEAWDYFFPNTDYKEKHRATDDAIHEAQILYEIYQRGFISL